MALGQETNLSLFEEAALLAKILRRLLQSLLLAVVDALARRIALEIIMINLIKDVKYVMSTKCIKIIKLPVSSSESSPRSLRPETLMTTIRCWVRPQRPLSLQGRDDKQENRSVM